MRKPRNFNKEVKMASNFGGIGINGTVSDIAKSYTSMGVQILTL